MLNKILKDCQPSKTVDGSLQECISLRPYLHEIIEATGIREMFH